jgi:hypothetical protein
MELSSITLPTSPASTFGAIFLGSVISAMCYGMTNIQALIYFSSYSKDPRIYKFSAAALWFLDTFHFIISIQAVYYYLVGDTFRTVPPIDIIWSIKLQTIINVVIVLIVQSLYALRLWKLSGIHHIILGYLAAGIILIGFAVGIVLAYEVNTLNSFLEINSISWAIIACFSTAAGIDTIIAISIFICIKRTQFVLPRLSSTLSSVLVYTLASGLLTSLCSIAALLCYIFMPNNFIFYSLGFVLTRLYINSFLALLNARPRPWPENNESTSPKNPRVSTTLSDRRRTFGCNSNLRSPISDIESHTEFNGSTYSVVSAPYYSKDSPYSITYPMPCAI